MDNLQTLLIAAVLILVLMNFITLVKVMQMANAQARREKRHQERNQNNGRNDNRGRDGKGGQNRPARPAENNASRGGRNDNRRRGNGNGNGNNGRGNAPQSNNDVARAPQKKTEDFVEVAGGSLREINQMLKAKPLLEEKKEPQASRNASRNNTPRNEAPRSSEKKSENTSASEAPVVARKPERPVGEAVQKATQPAEIVAPKTAEVREAAPAVKESSAPAAATPKTDKPVSYGRR